MNWIMVLYDSATLCQSLGFGLFYGSGM